MPTLTHIAGPRPLLERVSKKLLLSASSRELKRNRLEFALACSWGEVKTLERLKDQVDGFDWAIKMPMRDIRSPLGVAVECGERPVVEWLLDHGAQINPKASFLETPIPPAQFLLFGTQDLPRLFVSPNALIVLSLLLAHGLGDSINLTMPKGFVGFKPGNTLLHLASLSKQAFDLVPLLLRSGANPDIQNYAGNTSRHHLSAELLELLKTMEAKKELQENLPTAPLGKLPKSRL